MLVRVTEAGRPAFRLRKGEAALSVFDEEAVEPPLTEDEVLAAFRPGSGTVRITLELVHKQGLHLVSARGTADLPVRLQEAHAEIHPSPAMTRREFKEALRELEQ